MANFLKSLFIKGVEIDTTGASTGNVLSYNGTKFAPAAPGSGSLALDDLSDVVVTSPEEFQGLSYNGTSWVNSHIPLVSYVRNAESTTITTGTVVYLFGATGDHATVKRADKSSDTTSAKTIGVAGANITASNNGPVVTRGYVDGIDLSVGYTAGDILWLGDDGAFTTTKATAPDHLVFIGVVVRATSNGIVYVATQNGYELDELHNVSLPSPNSGEFLKYDGSLWVADAIDLGTDTVGNYVGTITAGTGVSTTGASTGEGIAHTISIGQSVATNASPSFAGLNIDSGTLYVDATNNRVGINRTNPGQPLDVLGNAKVTGDAYVESGLVDVRAFSAFDGVQIEGRSGGSGSYATKLTPTTLTANRTLTLPNASGTAITTGNLSDITGVGTLVSGSIPATFLTGTIASARISGSYTGITGVGTLSAGSIPATLLTGTVASARISGSYTGITEIGTLSTTLNGYRYTASGNQYWVTSSSSGGPTNNGYLSYTGAQADSGLPYCTGVTLGGRTGWAFYSEAASAWTMGYRGSVANVGLRYFWSANWALIGSTPADSLVVTPLNVIGGGAFFNSMPAGSGATVVNNFGYIQYVSSRRELKENIVSVPVNDALERVLALRPVEFTMKPEYVQLVNDLTPFDRKRGFIAQEVAAVDHWYGQWGWVDENQQMVSKLDLNEEADLSEATPIYWNHDAVIADLVACIQSLNARLAVLESN